MAVGLTNLVILGAVGVLDPAPARADVYADVAYIQSFETRRDRGLGLELGGRFFVGRNFFLGLEAGRSVLRAYPTELLSADGMDVSTLSHVTTTLGVRIPAGRLEPYAQLGGGLYWHSHQYRGSREPGFLVGLGVRF